MNLPPPQDRHQDGERLDARIEASGRRTDDPSSDCRHHRCVRCAKALIAVLATRPGDAAMDATERQFQARLQAIFRQEAEGHLQTLHTLLPALASSDAAASTVLSTMFRAAHSLKGAARAVRATDIEADGLALEQTLIALLDGRTPLDAARQGLLHEHLSRLVQAVQAQTESAHD